MSNISRVFKTPKGTELPLMNLKGKEYMQIMYRWMWFEEENERYDVSTDFIKLDDDHAIARCTISVLEDTSAGVRVVRKVTEYKKEELKHFPDFVEKAASGAAGRALIALGYGTQFAAADLDEGDRIVDSPVTVVAKTTAALKPAAKKEATTTVTSETSTDDTVSAATAPSTEVAATTPAAIPAKPANRFARKSTGGEFKL